MKSSVSVATACRPRCLMPLAAWVALWVALLPLDGRADWIRVASSQQSVFYLDSVKSPRVGSHVMVWVLRDHSRMPLGQAMLARSSKDQIEIDCASLRVRRIYSSDHLRPMGEGAMVHSEHGPMSWNNATANSTMRRIVDIACATP